MNDTISGDSDGKESACRAGDLDSIPGLGRSPGRRGLAPPEEVHGYSVGDLDHPDESGTIMAMCRVPINNCHCTFPLGSISCDLPVLFSPQTALGPEPPRRASPPGFPTPSSSGPAVRGGGVQSLLACALHGSGSSSTGWPPWHMPHEDF